MEFQEVIKRIFELGMMPMLVLGLSSFSMNAQSETTSMFRLSGKHVFELSAAEHWKIVREDVNEKTGEGVSLEIAVPSTGPKIALDLKKTKKSETTYYVTAFGKGLTKKYRVRIFEPNEVSTFPFKSDGNPDVRTFIFVPDSLSKRSRVIFAMHGLNRNADDYISSWAQWAKKRDYIVISPQFDQKNWKRSNSYNLGNMFRDSSGKNGTNPRSKWSFQVVENIFDIIKEGFGLSTNYFDMFGHSAGGQFVHRFTLFIPNSRVRIALAANSGWYTLPDLELKFPYGLKDPRLSITKDDITNWSKKHVFILRGTADTKRDSNLRQTREADAQGKNRYQRAGFMFQRMKAINPGTNWRLIDVPTVAHDQKRMAVAAQNVLNLIDSQSEN